MKFSFLEGLKPTTEQYAQAVAAGAEVVFALSDLASYDFLESEKIVPLINLSGIKICRAPDVVRLQIKELGGKNVGFSHANGSWLAGQKMDVFSAVVLDLLVVIFSQKYKTFNKYLIALNKLKIPIFALNSSGQYKIIGGKLKKDKGIIYFNI
ncbi:MAG: hypothetical protein V1655_00830 [bacterium]